MHLKDFRRELEKRAAKWEMAYTLHPPASEDQVTETEQRLGVTFHEQVRRFYLFCDGFEICVPHFQVNSISRLSYVRASLIHLATVDHEHRLAFDTSALNEAGQWSVVNVDTGFRVTYTMASIWSNKVWVWVDWGRRIWETL